MGKKNLLTGRDKELQELADRYESAKEEGTSIYMDADEFADLADWYVMHRRYADADEVLEYGLGIHPGSTSLLVVKANMCLERDLLDEAEEIVSQIEEETDEVTILKADLLYMEGHPRKAEAMLNKIEDKEDLMNIIDVAYLFLDNGDPQKAEKWLMRGQGLYDDDDAYIGAWGDCYQALGEPDKGIDCFNKLIDRVPYSATFWYGLARCYYDKEMSDKVIEACDYATDIDEEYGDAYMLKATSYSFLGNEEKALENYLLAEKYNIIPHSFIDAFRGVNCANKGEWQMGLDYLERALKAITDEEEGIYQFPQEDLYYRAAECLYALKKFTKARQYCHKAEKLMPLEPLPYILEGAIYMKQGDERKARKTWDNAFDVAPFAETLGEIAMRCVEANNYPVAKEFFEDAKVLDPDFENINEYLSALCLMIGDMDSFEKYNRQCRSPLKMKEVKRIQELYESFKKNLKDESMLSDVIDALYRTLHFK